MNTLNLVCVGYLAWLMWATDRQVRQQERRLRAMAIEVDAAVLTRPLLVGLIRTTLDAELNRLRRNGFGPMPMHYRDGQ